MSGAGEWVALFAREVDAGLAAARLVDPGGTLRVVGVTARVGATDASAGEPWEVELHWRPEGLEGAIREPSPPTLSPAVARLPITALRGVDRVWRHRLTAAGWRTVAALAEADLASVAALAETSGSRLPLVFRGRAGSCAVALPEAAPAWPEDRSVADLWTLPVARLAETLGWSAGHAEVLSRALLSLAAALDLGTLDRLSLADLLRR